MLVEYIKCGRMLLVVWCVFCWVVGWLDFGIVIIGDFYWFLVIYYLCDCVGLLWWKSMFLVLFYWK